MSQLKLDLPENANSPPQDDPEMGKLKDCHIVSVGKRRDGGTRYWCLEHKGDATAKYGKRGRRCRLAHITPIVRREVLELDVGAYRGGVALWGAVPPVYDTTRLQLDRGIHVHAREAESGDKVIDHTYRKVRVLDKSRPALGVHDISELDAIYFMVGSIFGFETKNVLCTYCNYSHLDKDWFSIHAHRRHLCAGCGRHFRDNETGIGNPIAHVRNALGAIPSRKVSPPNKIKLRQRDFTGGIQIWGSNPAIYWSANREEEEGIHLHAFGVDGKILKDDTYSEVSIDGEPLNAEMVRTLMAQSALPHIAGRVLDFQCPKCSAPHFDSSELAFTPHDTHVCGMCETEFAAPGRLRKTIGNPMIGTFRRLTIAAPREPQKHDIGLLPETI